MKGEKVIIDTYLCDIKKYNCVDKANFPIVFITYILRHID